MEDFLIFYAPFIVIAGSIAAAFFIATRTKLIDDEE